MSTSSKDSSSRAPSVSASSASWYSFSACFLPQWSLYFPRPCRVAAFKAFVFTIVFRKRDTTDSAGRWISVSGTARQAGASFDIHVGLVFRVVHESDELFACGVFRLGSPSSWLGRISKPQARVMTINGDSRDGARNRRPNRRVRRMSSTAPEYGPRSLMCWRGALCIRFWPFRECLDSTSTCEKDLVSN